MNESVPHFTIQAVGTVAVLVASIAFVWWQMRKDGRRFSIVRVFLVTLSAATGSLPFVAAFWWVALPDRESQRMLLVAAVFVPIFVIEAWGITYGIRRLRDRKHGTTG